MGASITPAHLAASRGQREPRLVRIPRPLLHVGLDDLAGLGIGDGVRDALRALLADLPGVPDAALSAQLLGPPEVTLACLAVLARHVGQGLRDANLALAEDRERLRAERLKLIFLDGAGLADALARGDARPAREAALFLSRSDAPVADSVLELLAARDAAGLVSFVTSTAPLAQLGHWRALELSRPD